MYQKSINFIERRFGIDAHYFVSNSFWVACNQATTIAGSLMVTAVFAHLLSEELFGNYRYLVVLASLFSVVSLNSISQSVLQTSSQGYLGYYQSALKLGLLSNLGTTVAALLVGGYYLYQNNQLLGYCCLAIAILQPFISNYFTIFSLLAGQQKFRAVAIFQTIKVIIITLGSIISVLLTHNIFIVFVTYLALQLVTNIMAHLFFKPNPNEIKKPISKEIEKKYNHFAFHLSVQNGILSAANRLDSIIVFQFLGATSLAIYSIALIVPDQFKSLVKNFSTLLFPKYVHYTSEQLVRSIPGRSFQLFVILLFLTGLYIISAPFIINWILPKYASAIIYTQLLSLAIPSSILYIVQSALKSQTNNTQLYYIQFSQAALKIIFVFVGIYFYGLWGAVAAYIISSYIEVALYYGVYFVQSIRKHPTA
ncbi:MAG: oligosaccharide flippase family protein [Patescibacteria group bacterium]